MTANGLSGRRFRFRRRATAPSSVASHARWNPPRPFTATIAPATDQRGDDLERVVRLRCRQQRDARATHRARHGLGVEPAVSRVFVLPTAFRAHRERAHRRPLAVVRQCLDDREPRPAVRAVDERVTEPPVAGVEQLGETGGARRGVGRDEPIPCAVDRGVDGEPAQSFHGGRRPRDGLDARERRRLAGERGRERLERFGSSLPRGSRRRRSRSARGRRRRGVRRAATRTGGSRRPGPRPGPRSAGPRGPAAPRARHSSYGGLRERGDFLDERVDERRERGGHGGREAVPRGERPRPPRRGRPRAATVPSRRRAPPPRRCPGRATRARRGARPAARRGSATARTIAPGSPAARRRPHGVDEHDGIDTFEQIEHLQRESRLDDLDLRGEAAAREPRPRAARRASSPASGFPQPITRTLVVTASTSPALDVEPEEVRRARDARVVVPHDHLGDARELLVRALEHARQELAQVVSPCAGGSGRWAGRSSPRRSFPRRRRRSGDRSCRGAPPSSKSRGRRGA